MVSKETQREKGVDSVLRLSDFCKYRKEVGKTERKPGKEFHSMDLTKDPFRTMSPCREHATSNGAMNTTRSQVHLTLVAKGTKHLPHVGVSPVGTGGVGSNLGDSRLDLRVHVEID